MASLGASRPVLWPAGHKARCAPLHLGDCTRASLGPAGSVCCGPQSRSLLSGLGALQVLFGPFLPALPAVHVDCALGGRRAGPGPCIIPGLNGAAARAGRVQAQLTLQPSGLAGQARSFLLSPLRPGSGEGVGPGSGEASRKATPGGRVRPSNFHSCNFCFGLGSIES